MIPGMRLVSLDADLIDILGRPNFACHHIAKVLRMRGDEIKEKAEHEQAAVIYYLLGKYLQHGATWRRAAELELQEIIEGTLTSNIEEI